MLLATWLNAMPLVCDTVVCDSPNWSQTHQVASLKQQQVSRVAQKLFWNQFMQLYRGYPQGKKLVSSQIIHPVSDLIF